MVDDEPQVRRNLARSLLERGYESLTAESGAAALALLATTSVDAMLVDLAMPEMTGIELVERAKQARPGVEIVVMAGLADLDAVPSALRAGAFGFINNPPVLEEEITTAVTRAVEKRELVKRARALEERLEQHERFGEIIGQSSRIREAYRVAMAAASVSSPVLILGESGAGKELFARAIHRHGPRASSPFIMIDCGAIPEELIEAELFGVEEDALRGQEARPGLLDAAGGGTVFLDAIGDLPLGAQARLRDALASLANSRAQSAPRVVAAASPDLRDRVAAAQFREDLFYRLAVITVELPPLRRRKEDIPLLAYSFLSKHAGRLGRDVKKISVEALRALREHPWPGNVRELESAIERAVVLARGEAIMPSDLPLSEGASPAKNSGNPSHATLGELPYPEAKERVIEAFDRSYIEDLMERASGNISEAARRAGMDRSNFRRLLRKVQKSP